MNQSTPTPRICFSSDNTISLVVSPPIPQYSCIPNWNEIGQHQVQSNKRPKAAILVEFAVPQYTYIPKFNNIIHLDTLECFNVSPELWFEFVFLVTGKIFSSSRHLILKFFDRQIVHELSFFIQFKAKIGVVQITCFLHYIQIEV